MVGWLGGWVGGTDGRVTPTNPNTRRRQARQVYWGACGCMIIIQRMYLLGDEAAGVGLELVGEVRVREEDVGVDVVPDHVLSDVVRKAATRA